MGEEAGWEVVEEVNRWVCQKGFRGLRMEELAVVVGVKEGGEEGEGDWAEAVTEVVDCRTQIEAMKGVKLHVSPLPVRINPHYSPSLQRTRGMRLGMEKRI